jgi:cyclic pyranopterin phosphate synthase
MPEEGIRWMAHEDILSYEEILRLCRILWDMGMNRVRITGGEPLVRRGVVPFLARLRESLPGLRVALTTNGALLGQAAEELARIGLDALNVSLDTLDPERFAFITRVGRIEEVRAGIEAARDARVGPLKLNAVMIRDFNDREVPVLLDYAESVGAVLRLIEFMPLEDPLWSGDRFISAAEILGSLPEPGAWVPLPEEPGGGPARYYRHERTRRKLGIIAAVSDHFCARCNRLRISAAGGLRTCLFQGEETSLRPLFAEGDRAVAEGIRMAVRNKPRDWMTVRDGHQHMSCIGG